MCDCKVCEYGTTLFVKEKTERFVSDVYKPYGKIACSKPSYSKRTFLVKEKTECDSFKRRERHAEK